MSKPVVLITGALTGIGRATALAFARNGASLLSEDSADPERDAGLWINREEFSL